jgi:hypothetical protein
LKSAGDTIRHVLGFVSGETFLLLDEDATVMALGWMKDRVVERWTNEY